MSPEHTPLLLDSEKPQRAEAASSEEVNSTEQTSPPLAGRIVETDAHGIVWIESTPGSLAAEAEPATPETLPPQPETTARERPEPIEALETEEIMAAFRKASRGKGGQERDELLKEVSRALGYQRLGKKVREVLKGHLRAAIRRKIIEAEGDLVRAGHATMEEYDLEDLRETICSVMRPGRKYEREEVIHAVARYLGFVRVKETVEAPIKSAINSAIRQDILAYEGNTIWRAP